MRRSRLPDMRPDHQIEFLRRFTLLAVALTLGVSAMPLLDVSTRLAWEPHIFIASQRASFFAGWRANVSNMLELTALLSMGLLAWFIPSRGAALIWAALAIVCLMLANLVWSVAVLPVQSMMLTWTSANMPYDQSAIRDNWESAIILVGMLKAGALIGIYCAPCGGAGEFDRLSQ